MYAIVHLLNNLVFFLHDFNIYYYPSAVNQAASCILSVVLELVWFSFVTAYNYSICAWFFLVY